MAGSDRLRAAPLSQCWLMAFLENITVFLQVLFQATVLFAGRLSS